MLKSPDRYIRCRFCDYRVRPFTRGADGKVRSGWARLQAHLENMHEAELLAEALKVDDYMRKRCGGRSPR